MTKPTKLQEILIKYTTYLKRAMGGRQVGGEELDETQLEQAISDLITGALPEEENPDQYSHIVSYQQAIGYNQALKDIKFNLKQRGIGE